MKIPLGFILLASIAVVPFSVNAGFQFTPAIEQPINQITPLPQMPVVPAVTVEKEAIESVIQMTSPSPQPVSVATSNDLAVGFGKDLPMTTALEQVIPQGYTYTIDDGVKVNQNVSWSGGKPWPSVIGDMLEPLGLRAELDGRAVRVMRPSLESQPMVQQARQPDAKPVELISTSHPSPKLEIFDTLQSDLPYAGAPMAEPAPLVKAKEEIIFEAPKPVVQPTIIPSKSQSVNVASTESNINESVVVDVTKGQWMAQSGNSLKTVLESWSNIEGVDLFWSADYDFMLAGDANVSGNFEEAVEELLKGFSSARPKPIARLHPNLPHGPAVLVVEVTQAN